MKNLLPYDGSKPAPVIQQLLLLVIAGWPREFLVAALNAYSMLGIEENAPVAELCDGSSLVLPASQDWCLKIDENWPDDGFCQILDVNQDLIAGSETTIFNISDSTFPENHSDFKSDITMLSPLCPIQKHSCVLETFSQTRNTVLFQEFLRQISLAVNHGAPNTGQSATLSAEIYSAIESRQPNIFYANWCAINCYFHNNSYFMECYDERIYVNRVIHPDPDPDITLFDEKILIDPE